VFAFNRGRRMVWLQGVAPAAKFFQVAPAVMVRIFVAIENSSVPGIFVCWVALREGVMKGSVKGIVIS
jgi:hypothetical protein